MPDSKHLLDPDFPEHLSLFPGGAIDAGTLPKWRALFDGLSIAPSEPDLGVAEHSIPDPAGKGKLRLVVYTPLRAARPLPMLVYVHGGGYVIGTPEMSDGYIRYFAKEAGCVVVSVDYSIAPEAVFPTAVEQCYAALRWAHAEARALGGDASRIAVMGESAGGGLAAGLVVLARDRGEIKLCGQVLIYPMLDDRNTDVKNPSPVVGEYVWMVESNHFGWASILGKAPGGADTSPYAAAARVKSVEGLPPTFIAVGALDLFLEEDIEFARRLLLAGIPTELHVYPGAPHGYHMMSGPKTSQRARADQLAALKRLLAAA